MFINQVREPMVPRTPPLKIKIKNYKK